MIKAAAENTSIDNKQVIIARSLPAHKVSFQRTPNRSVSSHKTMREGFLIARLKADDYQAFNTIFNKYANQVYRQALRLIGSEADAEDVVQEVFLTVYKKIKTFRGQSQFKTWLYRLTVNAALIRLRNNKKKREVPLDDYLPRFLKDGRHYARPATNWSYEVDDHSKRQELQQLLKVALNQLDSQNRAVVLMSDLQGFANHEIANFLGLSLYAVKARLHRARQFLRNKLGVP